MKKIAIIILSIMCLFSYTMFFACSNNNEQTGQGAELTLISSVVNTEVGGNSKVLVGYSGTKALEYSSADENIAVVDGEGLVTGISQGETFITIKLEDEECVCKVIVSSANYSIYIGHTQLTLIVGSSHQFVAETLYNGMPYDDNVSWDVSEKDTTKVNFSVNGKKATFSALQTGNYSVTVSTDRASTECQIKVVADGAKRLQTPTLTVNKCATLSWNSVANATHYDVSIDGGDWNRVNEDTFNISDFVDLNQLKEGQSLQVLVKAIAHDNYNYYDSYVAEIKISHNYTKNAVTTCSCVTAGTMEFECVDCGAGYVENNYYTAHSFEQNYCLECGACVNDVVLYQYDDNYIPMPTPEDAANPNSAWRIKYAPYYVDLLDEIEVGLFKENYHYLDDRTYYDELWNEVNKNKNQIPVEDREVCYFAAGLLDTFASEVYVAGVYNDGSHGTLPVRYVKRNAFAELSMLTRVEIAENVKEIRGHAFYRTFSLETVIIKGVTFFPYISRAEYSHDNFNDCYSLKTLVLPEGVQIDGREFYQQSWGHTYNQPSWAQLRQIDIYIAGDKDVEYRLWPERFASEHNGLLSKKVFRYDQVEDGYECGTWSYTEQGEVVVNHHKYESNGKIFVCSNCGKKLYCEEEYYNNAGELTIREHSFNADNSCVYCGAIDDKGLTYKYDQDRDCYYLAGFKYVSNILEVAAQYNDGTNGLKDVKYIARGVFSYNSVITHVILPETIEELGNSTFAVMPNLYFISMPGVTTIKTGDPTTKIMNTFLDDTNLSIVIINKDLNVDSQCFYDRGDESADFSIYVYETGGTISMYNIGIQNNMWDGNIYTYDEDLSKCLSWRFAEEGYKLEVSTTTPVDNDGDGYCDHEGCAGVVVDRTKAVLYSYDEQTASYKVINNPVLSTPIVKVASTFDDGVHGTAAVTKVDALAFIANSYITHIILPESVTELGNGCFQIMPKLEMVAMPGVKELVDEGNRAHFWGTRTIRQIVVGKDLKVSVQCFVVSDKQSDAKLIPLYFMEKGGMVSINNEGGRNDMLNGEKYYYDINLSQCKTWRYAEDGYSIEINNNPVDTNGDGYCDHEGCIGVVADYSTAILYNYNERTNSYEVIKNNALITPIVEVASTFDDGIHGQAPVTKIASSAFSGNTYITHVILPESITILGNGCFQAMPSLKMVAMPGVSNITDETNRAHFWGSKNLETIVIGKDLKITIQSIVASDKQADAKKVTLYILEVGGEISISNEGGRNDMLNGKRYYYDANLSRCNTWRYVGDTYEIETFYNPIDNDGDGYCDHEGCSVSVDETKTLSYEWNDVTSSYKVVKNDNLSVDVVRVRETFNDGIHGQAAVTEIDDYAFQNNKNITHIILPTSVNVLGLRCFEGMSNLKVVVMPGVTAITNSSKAVQFWGCTALETIVVGSELTISVQSLTADNGTVVNQATIYSLATDAKESNINVTYTLNYLWKAHVMYYSDTLKCEKWTWAENGIDVVSRDHVDENKDGYCDLSNCNGVSDPTIGIIYVWNGSSYSVAENSKLQLEVIRVASTYDDGVHGVAPVTEVGSAAFIGCTLTTHVILPESVKTIGNQAFVNMPALTTIVMPGVDTLTAIKPFRPRAGMNDAVDKNLKYLVVNENFTVGATETLQIDGGSAEYVQIMLLSLGGVDNISVANVASHNYHYKGKLAYSSTVACGKWTYDQDGYTILYRNHEDVNKDGYCDYEDCNLVVDASVAIQFGWDAQTETYYVAKNSALTLKTVVIPEEWNDGVHGVAPVTKVSNGAFQLNHSIKAVFLPETVTIIGDSAFAQMGGLKTVVMPGVMAIDGSNGMNQFYASTELLAIIVTKDLTISVQCVANGTALNQVTICTLEKGGTITVTGNNNMLNGRVLYKGDQATCYSWIFDEDGYTVLSKDHEDTNGDGYCDAEGCYNTVDKTKAILFRWNEETQSYFVANNSNLTLEKIIVPEVWNDGIHGIASVTGLDGVAFAGCTKTTHVILPESVTTIGNSAFVNMPALSTIVMPGVETLTAIKPFRPRAGTEDAKNVNLKYLVVNENFTVGATETLQIDGGSAEYVQIMLLSLGGVDNISVAKTDTHNYHYKGKLAYNSTAACGMWTYGEDGYSIVIQNHVNEDGDGYCDQDGCYEIVDETKAVHIEWDDTLQTYKVVKNANLTASVVKVPAEYSDKVNGLAPVTVIGKGAFQLNHSIKTVILPKSVTIIEDSAFAQMGGLKTIIMPGVTLIDGTNGMNQFYASPELNAVVIDKDLTISTQSIANGTALMSVNIYAMQQGGTISISSRNNMYSGVVLYMAEELTCGKWTFDEDGYTILTKDHLDNDGDGYCDNDICNEVADITKAILFNWDSNTNSYFVAPNSALTIEKVVVPSVWNDGIHGEAAVTGVRYAAFAGCTNITHVILPESVTIIENSAFVNMPALTTIVMPGVETLTAIKPFRPRANTSDVKNTNLKYLVVNENFTVGATETLQIDGGSGEFVQIMLLSLGGVDNISVANIGSHNYHYKGKLAYSSTVACGKWTYDQDGYTIVIGEHKDNNDDGYCDADGCFAIADNSKAAHIQWDDTLQTYKVVKNAGLTASVVKVLAEYDDGTHGLKPVTQVANLAFESLTAIETIVLPKSITKVGSQAFVHMTSIKTVIMPGVTQMGGDYGVLQFTGSKNLTAIVIGKDLVVSGQCLTFDGGTVVNTIVIYALEEGGTITIPYSQNYAYGGTKKYYSEEKPSENHSNYWHYDTDGVTPILWTA